MPEEVKIVVKQESQGDALVKAQAELKRLQELEANYRAKGLPEAAASVRAEALPVSREVARLTKERRADEKAITDHQREQAAVKKGQESRRMQLLRAGVNFAEGQVGAGGFTGLTSALGSMGGPAGLVAALAAAIGTAVIAAEAERSRTFAIGEMKSGEDRKKDIRHAERMQGFEGTAAGSREEARAARQEAEEREDAKARLERQSKPRWWHPDEAGLWVNNLFGAGMKTTEGEENERENARKQSQALKRATEADENARKKFLETGAREIEIQEKLALGDRKSARILEDKLTRYHEYIRLRKEDATEEEATRGANAKVANIQRERAGQYGRLITTRDGMADVARVATLAAEQRGGWRVSGVAGIGASAGASAGGGFSGFQELRVDMNRNHREAADAAWRTKFARP